MQRMCKNHSKIFIVCNELAFKSHKIRVTKKLPDGKNLRAD